LKNYTPDEATEFARALRQSATLGERRLWARPRGGQTAGAKFKRQVPFAAYVADFACASARLIVEVDGPSHLDGPSRERDDVRDAWFHKAGYLVLRFTDEEVTMATDRVVDVIRRAVLARAAPSPGRHPPTTLSLDGRGK
jgi:very-short-patch-repair endonuclease